MKMYHLILYIFLLLICDKCNGVIHYLNGKFYFLYILTIFIKVIEIITFFILNFVYGIFFVTLTIFFIFIIYIFLCNLYF